MAKARKQKTIYESVASNIQKITLPSGTVSYRVRVGLNGERLSMSADSLKKAKIARKQLMA